MFRRYRRVRAENLTSVFRKNVIVYAYPVLARGALRIVTNVERGMRWTPWLHRTSGAGADGEIVWSRPPDAEVKLLAGRSARGDGGKQARRTEESTYKP